jgi:hypothetical protein
MADTRKVVIIDLELETNQYLKQITDARKEVEKLKSVNKELTQNLKDAGEIGSASWNKTNKALVENEAQLRKAKSTLSTLQKEYDNLEATQKKQADEAEKSAQAQAQLQAKAIQDAQKQAQIEAQLQAQREAENQKAVESAKELEIAMQTMGDTIGEALGDSPEQRQLIENITNTKVALAELNNVNNTLKNGLKGVSIGSEEYKKITQAIAENEAQTRQAKGELNNYTKQLDNLGKVNQAQAGSYEKLYRQYVDAEVKLKTLANTVKVNADGTIVLTAEYKKAQAEVLKLKEGLLQFNAGIKDGRLNVGNYTQSFQQAIQNTGAFGQAINQVQGIIQSGTSVYNAVTEGTKLIADGYNTTVEAVKNFTGTWGKSNDTVTSGAGALQQGSTALDGVTDSAKEATQEVGKVGEGAKDAGQGVNAGMTVGARGTQLLKAGLASIGIGLIITAVVALIGYFSKFQSGIDKLKQAMAGLTAIFETYIGTIVDVVSALATLDFGKAIDSITSFGNRAVESASKAMQLEKAKQALEQQDIDNIAIQGELKREIEDLILLSEDKTKTDQERIDAIKEAGEQEKKLLTIQADREAEALRILKEENQARKEKGQLSRADAKAEEELTQKVLDLRDDIIDKEIEVASRTSKLRKQLRADEISSTIGLLQDQLRLAEINGGNTVKLAKDIAKQERDAKLEDTQLSAKQRELIESNYQVRIAEINAEARANNKAKAEQNAEEQKALTRATQDAILNTIIDARTREVAIEAENLKRKLEDIKGNGAKQEALRTALTQESANKVLEIERNYAQQNLAEQTEQLNKSAEAQRATIEKNAKDRADALAVEKSKGLITEEQYTQQVLQLEVNKQDSLLQLQNEYTAQRKINDALYFEEQQNQLKEQRDANVISEENYQAQLTELKTQKNATELETETQTQAELTAVTEAGNDARLQQTIKTNETLLENTKQTAEAQKQLQAQLLDATKTALNSFSQLLQKNEQDRKRNAKAIQALAIGEILINAYQEISGYWTGAGKDASKTVYGGLGAVVLAGVLSASAIARAVANIGAVKAQKFAKGGFTGGYVESPTLWEGADGGMKLAGEAGTEWVSPAWQIKQAPTLFASLEQWRRTGVKTFADGGFTSSTISAPIINTSETLEGAITRGFANAPAPMVAVTEINDIQTRVSVIESRSSL